MRNALMHMAFHLVHGFETRVASQNLVVWFRSKANQTVQQLLTYTKTHKYSPSIWTDTCQDMYCWWIFSHVAGEQYLHVFIFLSTSTGFPSGWVRCTSGLYGGDYLQAAGQTTPVAPKLPLLSISVPPTVVACSGRGGLWWLLSSTHAHRTTEQRTIPHHLSPLWERTHVRIYG